MRCQVALLAFSSLLFAVVAHGQRMTVKVIDRRTSETNYTYHVPGRSYSTTTGSAGCNSNAFGSTINTDCSGTANTNTVTTAPQTVSFNVTGATFALLLPDQRIAVVNCVSKFQERFAGPSGNHRSCRMPLVDELDVEFKGKNAKMEWVVSLDGKKKESETYTILSVLPAKHQATAAQGKPDTPAPTN
jgi:hypothetical protein